MTDITIRRWAKYGHQRGYATAADGTKFGWIDLKTGAVTQEDGVDAVAVTAALMAWSSASLPDSAPASTPFDVLAEPEQSAGEAAGVDVAAVERRVGRPRIGGKTGRKGERRARVNVAVTDAQAAIIDRLAGQGRTRSDIVREALDEYLATRA